jgi:hypothetical protein
MIHEETEIREARRGESEKQTGVHHRKQPAILGYFGELMTTIWTLFVAQNSRRTITCP